ncbi:MAG TPA: M56 family metallopeptidase [Terriglobales bacterium]|nr:M56 family metallopeptidase [Terriglobales bacterium]
MIDLLLASTLLFSLAALAVKCMGRASAAQRHAVWMLAFLSIPLAILVSTVVAPFVPELPMQITAAAAGLPEQLKVVKYISVRVTPDWMKYLWVAGAALLLLRLSISFLRLYRTRKDVTVPLVFGVLHPEILLPKSATGWPTKVLTSVVLHEQAHICRWDGLAQIFAQISCAILWFQPLAWYAANKAAEEREKACDDYVLATGVPADEYASHLLFVAKEFVPSGALPMARPSSLETRLRAVADERRSRAGLSRRWRIGLLATTAASVFCVSSLLGEQAEKIYNVADEGVTAPSVFHKVDANYTPEAKAEKISGSVTLSFEIAPSGLPREIKVVEGLDRGLDQNAIAALRQWRFNPATREGRAVPVAAKVKFQFRLR